MGRAPDKGQELAQLLGEDEEELVVILLGVCDKGDELVARALLAERRRDDLDLFEGLCARAQRVSAAEAGVRQLRGPGCGGAGCANGAARRCSAGGGRSALARGQPSHASSGAVYVQVSAAGPARPGMAPGLELATAMLQPLWLHAVHGGCRI